MNAISRRAVLRTHWACRRGLGQRLSLAARRAAQHEASSQGANFEPIPIAIPEFIGLDPKMATDVANVVAADLKRSGLFRILDPQAFIDRTRDPAQTPRMADWKAIGAEALVLGAINRSPDGRLQAIFRGYDVNSEQNKVGKQLTTNLQNWRRLGHLIADEIYREVHGREGLLRHPHRLRRRERPQAKAHQAPGHHGSGRLQPAAAESRAANSS